MTELTEKEDAKGSNAVAGQLNKIVMLRDSDEARRIWKAVFPHYDQQTFAESMNITPSKLSEMLNNKREFSLRVIRYLVSCGADAEIMIRDNKPAT